MRIIIRIISLIETKIQKKENFIYIQIMFLKTILSHILNLITLNIKLNRIQK